MVRGQVNFDSGIADESESKEWQDDANFGVPIELCFKEEFHKKDDDDKGQVPYQLVDGGTHVDQSDDPAQIPYEVQSPRDE